MILLSSVIVMAVFSDVEGPLIYQVEILPVSPATGDTITVSIYALDQSGVYGAELSYNINDGGWQQADMQFYTCLCISGGRWSASFGPLSLDDTVQFYGTAFDDSPTRNSGNSETFTIQIGD
ncbi:MAG: hypothetical protein ACW98Y_22030 [Candidatus Thorarchaeota archaeon]